MSYIWQIGQSSYRAILLCGFMGAGKTRLLKGLKKTGPGGIRYIDLDGLLVERSGLSSVAKLMKNVGEEHFRRLEWEALVELMGRGGCLVALGGGAVDWALMEAINRRGDILTIWLDRPLEDCLANVKRDRRTVRPLIKRGGGFVRELYKKRLKIYSAARLRFDARSLEEVGTYELFMAEVVQRYLKVI